VGHSCLRRYTLDPQPLLSTTLSELCFGACGGGGVIAASCRSDGPMSCGLGELVIKDFRFRSRYYTLLN